MNQKPQQSNASKDTVASGIVHMILCCLLVFLAAPAFAAPIQKGNKNLEQQKWLKQLSSKNKQQRQNAIATLSKMEEAALPFLLKALHSKNRSVHNAIVKIFRAIGQSGQKAIPQLEKHAQSTYLLESWTACQSLAFIGYKSLPSFAKLLKSKVSHVRAYVLIALGQRAIQKPKQQANLLLQGIRSSDIRIRFHAHQSLAQLKVPSLVLDKVLDTMLRESNELVKKQSFAMLKMQTHASILVWMKIFAYYRKLSPFLKDDELSAFAKRQIVKKLKTLKDGKHLATAFLRIVLKAYKANQDSELYTLIVKMGPQNPALTSFVIQVVQNAPVKWLSHFINWAQYVPSKDGMSQDFPKYLKKSKKFQQLLSTLLKSKHPKIPCGVLNALASGTYISANKQWMGTLWSLLRHRNACVIRRSLVQLKEAGQLPKRFINQIGLAFSKRGVSTATTRSRATTQPKAKVHPKATTRPGATTRPRSHKARYLVRRRAHQIAALLYASDNRLRYELEQILLENGLHQKYRLPLYWKILTSKVGSGDKSFFILSQTDVFDRLKKEGTKALRFLPILRRLKDSKELIISANAAKAIIVIDKTLTSKKKKALRIFAKKQFRLIQKKMDEEFRLRAKKAMAAESKRMPLDDFTQKKNNKFFEDVPFGYSSVVSFPPDIRKKRHPRDFPKPFRGWGYGGVVFGASSYQGFLQTKRAKISIKWRVSPKPTKAQRQALAKKLKTTSTYLGYCYLNTLLSTPGSTAYYTIHWTQKDGNIHPGKVNLHNPKVENRKLRKCILGILRETELPKNLKLTSGQHIIRLRL